MTQEDLNSRRFNDLESSRVRRGERSRLSLSVIAVMPLRNESESRVGLPRVRPRVTGPNQSQPGHYHPEDCYSLIYRLPFPASVCSLFPPKYFRLFFPLSFLLSLRVSAHVALPAIWTFWFQWPRDDADVLSRASLVSAFCRDRRGGLGDSEMESTARR